MASTFDLMQSSNLWPFIDPENSRLPKTIKFLVLLKIVLK